jgi:hypothetical protein
MADQRVEELLAAAEEVRRKAHDLAVERARQQVRMIEQMRAAWAEAAEHGQIEETEHGQIEETEPELTGDLETEGWDSKDYSDSELWADRSTD